MTLLLAACTSPEPLPPPIVVPPPVMVPQLPKIGLALGGGAARGFAHVGVIKMLESQGIKPDLVVGTSAGSVVGSLYAAGHGGFELQEMTFDLDRAAFADWQFFGRGLLRGEALQKFINEHVGGKPIEQLPMRFGAVATRLRTGEGVLFQRGDVGMAVRASSAIPGVFVSPVIGGEEYVDGGTVAPVPAEYARQMGAELVIAVDISQPVAEAPSDSTLRTVLKTFDIMGNALKGNELKLADVVISPNVKGIAAADFESKQRAILEGERAALAAIPKIREAIAAKTRMVPAVAPAPVLPPVPAAPIVMPPPTTSH
ncbi:patatin-like phospholipase family protein [Hydrocarboniphaga sp.]|uniref:patatin-like phospholipase family protein n=1 Tax=Hydrocarboniphaga sp. TaxID=2033016 RepID=UPI003D11570F